MSKRAAQFERHERDFYPTPPEAVLPLRPFIDPYMTFYEPCAGDGCLAVALFTVLGLTCTGMSDVDPQGPDIATLDLFDIKASKAHYFITNPPWERELLHRVIDHLKWIRPTWLLLDADWLFTKQAAPYIPDATHIVPIGRVKWMPGSAHVGKDNACWVRFKGGYDAGPKFYPNW